MEVQLSREQREIILYAESKAIIAKRVCEAIASAMAEPEPRYCIMQEDR